MANQSLEPYVDLLRKAFGVPQSGTLIPYVDICRVLNEGRCTRNGYWRCTNTRWYAIVGKWRGELDSKHNVVTKAKINVGIEVLPDNKRIIHAGDIFAKGIRNIKKCHSIASRTHSANLDNEHKELQVFYVKTSKGILVKTATASKKSKARNSHGLKILHNIDK